MQNGLTNPFCLAKRCLLSDGLIVPVDDAEEADDAEEESSSWTGVGRVLMLSSISSCSLSVNVIGRGGS